MKKGFTLMEILAVLLVIAVVASFAVPVIRSIRSEMRYQRAKAAALKIAEAMRSYYYNTKGYGITGTFGGSDKGGDVAQTYALATCNDDALSGVPASERGVTGGGSNNISVLFNCHYLNPKDFRDLPYTFTTCDNSLDNCITANACPGKGFVYATGNTDAGQYMGKKILVRRDMTICEEE